MSALSAALSRGLIEAYLGLCCSEYDLMLSAALSRGLIEAIAACAVSAATLAGLSAALSRGLIEAMQRESKNCGFLRYPRR